MNAIDFQSIAAFEAAVKKSGHAMNMTIHDVPRDGAVLSAPA
jgi:hypothetical protein